MGTREKQNGQFVYIQEVKMKGRPGQGEGEIEIEIENIAHLVFPLETLIYL